MDGMHFFAKLYNLSSSSSTSKFHSLTSDFMECTQHSGDIMYVPPLYAHSTLNTMQSIGVAHEFSVEPFCME
jgi:ribosomal protein L16 Arg81 hydroxylase